MKRLFALLLIMIMLICNAYSAFATDYSYLDGMTLDELVALQEVVASRITAAKKAAGSNTDDTGMWVIKYYVDEFNEPTTEGYITNTSLIEGTFSNSATTKSELKVKFLIDKDDVAIILYEYGRSQVKNSSSKYSDTYNITIKDSSGKKHSFTGTMYSSGDRIYFKTKDMPAVLSILSENGKISFSIVDSERSINSYVFTIQDSSFFSNAYAQLTGKQI